MMTSSSKVEFLDKYFGSLLGAVIGDALGWPQEDRSMRVGKMLQRKTQFQKWTRRNGFRYLAYEEEISPGSYSDDSQLLFATARSLQYINWFSHFVKVELPTWLVYERGGGGATKRAADLWSKGQPPWKLEKQKREYIKKYFNAGGNGVTMRILPHVFYCYGNLNEISNQVFLNGIATHGHPRALLSAILYSWALHYHIGKEDVLGYGELVEYLLNEKDKWSTFPNLNNLEGWKEAANLFTNGQYMNIWEETAEELVKGLTIIKNALDQGMLDRTNETLTKLNCFDKKTRGAGTVACLVAIYIASKYASDPVAGLMEVSFLKDSDADTNASMVGGLLGSIHGTEWIIPDWYLVQDYDYIRTLVNKLNAEKNSTNPRLWHWSDRDNFKKKLENLEIGDKLVLCPFGHIELVEKIKNKPITRNVDPTTYKFLSDQGQTLYINVSKKVIPNTNSIALKRTDKLNKKILLGVNEIEKLINLIPPRISAKKTLTIILNLLDNIEDLDVNNEKVIESLASRYVQKGFELNTVIEIIKLVVNSNKSSS